jgi:OmpA-OmpF porin, OOP family
MTLRPIFPVLATFFALAACHTLTPAPSFVQELNKQYQNLSTAEGEEMYDWTDAAYFSTKGKRALKGADVQPEDPATWRVPAEQLPELNNAYDMLQIALVPDRKKVTSPVNAAQAQAYFDCWVEQAQEKWIVTAKRNDCRAHFYEAMCRMYKGHCTISRDRIYRVFFGTGSVAIDGVGRKTVMTAVDAYRQGASEVIVAGHADRVGNPDANMALSMRRAAAVKAALTAHGVPAGKITEKYFGESQPIVATPDNVPNRNNRRVLIVVR